jgi:hypothetical protein
VSSVCSPAVTMGEFINSDRGAGSDIYFLAAAHETAKRKAMDCAVVWRGLGRGITADC